MSVSVAPPPPSADRPRFSGHARMRMTELRVSESMVKEALQKPLTTQPGRPEHDNHAIIYTGPAIRVVFDPVTATTITVQLRTDTPYVHGVHHLENLPGDTTISRHLRP